MVDTSASAASIRSMGNKIGDLKNDITPVLGSLKGLTVTPGDFPDALTLKTTTEDRRDEVIAFLTTLGDNLDDTKQKLYDNAKEIEDTEDINAGESDWPSK
jgi:hypothetical protein